MLLILTGASIAAVVFALVLTHRWDPLLEGTAVILTAVGVGSLGRPRAWLRATICYFIGVVWWVATDLRPSPPWSASDVWGSAQWAMFAVSLTPSFGLVAILGAVGGWLRKRVDGIMARPTTIER